MPNNFPLDVFFAAAGINDFFGQRIFQYRVDRKVASRTSFLKRHPGIAFDDKPLMTTADLSVTSWYRDIQIVAELVNCERLADDIDIAKLIQDLLQLFRLDPVDLEIPLGRFDPHQLIAHASADEHRAATDFADCPC